MNEAPEVVGQVCTGKFAVQKVAFMYGFDLDKVGIVNEKEYQKNFE